MRPSTGRAPGAPRLLSIVMVAAFLGGLPTPTPAIDLPPLRSTSAPFFTADLAITLDRDQRPGVSVAVSVPYQGLEWVRIPGTSGADRFGAGVEFTITFEGPGDHLPGDAWERRLVVGAMSEARSSNAVISEKRTFPVMPGKYRVRISVSDLNSGAKSSVQEKITVQDFTRLAVGFADLELGVVDSVGVFHPVPTRRFGMDSGRIGARAALFDRRAGSWPRRYPLQYRIRGDDGEIITSGSQEVSLDVSGEPVLVRPAMTDLFLGSYVLEVELAEGKSRWRVERSFEVDESGPPRGREFTRMLEPLSYVVSPEEMNWLRALPADQQARGWDEVWRRRDPTPETPRNEMQIEFFRRVRYAERHFQGFGPGWRSDMGRIYIKFGPPDQIEARPATLSSPQLEIWYYNQPHRRLVFADREGFGRYTLLTPE